MKYLLMIIIGINLCGCSRLQVQTPKAMVLQADRIYTIPAGQSTAVLLDKKPTQVTFSEDMKVTTIDHLLSNERKLNDAVLDKAKIDKSRGKWIGILGSLLAILAGCFGAFWKAKGGINLKMEAKT